MKFYHVVCRDCDLERVSEDRDEAMALWEEHGDGTGHRVRYAEFRADDGPEGVPDGQLPTGEARQ
jgi:hypothetical protein